MNRETYRIIPYYNQYFPINTQSQLRQSAIDVKLQELIKKGFIGIPIIEEKTTPDGSGRYRHYRDNQGNEWSIYWHPNTGAHEIHGAIHQKWANLGWERFGYPITDELTTPDGRGRFNHFRAVHLSSKPEGSIYWTPETGAHEVYGAIRDKWAKLGWERSQLGYPVDHEKPTFDGIGRSQHFQGGIISWHPETGAHVVWGLIGERWLQIGREQFGYPITDELITPDKRGRFNHFRAVHLSKKPEGSIYWAPETGAHEVYGAIRSLWAKLGWEKGRLGYPIDHEKDQSGGDRVQHFQKGYISWNLQTGAQGHFDPIIAPPSSPPPVTPPLSKPTINVSKQNSKLVITGFNFKPNASIRIRFVVGFIGNETSVHINSNNNSSFIHEEDLTGVPIGTTIWVSATDGRTDSNDLTGFLWSNTVPITR